MRTEDAPKESRDIESCLREAEFEFKQRRYAESIRLYEQALDGMRTARPPGHPDITFCLSCLGDACAFGAEYEKAITLLLELHEIRQRQPGLHNADLIATTFKLAKMFEMSGNFQESAAAYDGAVQLAERSLYAGHPMLNMIYSHYAEMLRRSRGDANIAKGLDKKVSESGTSGFKDNVLESQLNLKSYDTLVMEPIPEPVEPTPPEEEGPPPKPMISKEAWRNSAIFIVAISVLSAAGYVVWRVQQIKTVVTQQQKIASKFDGKIYTSADGLDRVEFLKGGTADVIIHGVHRKLPITGLPSNTMLSASLTGAERNYRQTADTLEADDGIKLYEQGDPEIPILERMKHVVEAAQKFYDEHKEYPTTLKELTDIDPKLTDNTVTGNPEEMPVINAGKERDWDADDPTDAPEIEKKLHSQDLLDGEPAFTPGAIHCYVYFNGTRFEGGEKAKGFFLRAGDRDGKPLPGHRPGSAFVASMLGGRPPILFGITTPREPQASDPTLRVINVIEFK